MVSISPLIGFLGRSYAYTKRGVNLVPELLCGTGSEVLSQGIKNAKGSPLIRLNSGFSELEKHVLQQKGGFWQRTWNNISSLKNIFKDAGVAKEAFLKKASSPEHAKALERLLKMKGTTLEGLASKVYRGNVLKSLGKRVPLIGSALLLLTELPNIWSATKDKGLFAGAKEAVKSVSRLSGAMVGSAIGQALIPVPFLGGIIGWCAGEWLTSKIVGKSYSEKKYEQQELAKQSDQIRDIQEQSLADAQKYVQSAQNSGQVQTPYPLQPALYPQLNNMTSNPYIAYQMQTSSTPYQNDMFMQKMPFNRVV